MKQLTEIFKNMSPAELIVMSLILLSTLFIFFSAFVDPLMIIKGFLFTLFMLAISYCDAKTKTIPDLLLIPLIPIGFIRVSWESLAGAAIAVPFLIVALIAKTEVIGGGDIKLIAAYGFVLGRAAVMGVLFGSCIFIVRYLYPRLMRKKDTYALAPSLSLGCFFAYMLL
ncbi:prepilin peptidase [Caproiciproducens sp. LBM24188]